MQPLDVSFFSWILQDVFIQEADPGSAYTILRFIVGGNCHELQVFCENTGSDRQSKRWLC